MKATLTCEKIAPGQSRFTAEVDISEELINYEGVISTDSDIDFLVPDPGDTDKKLTRLCVLHHSEEAGAIACFHFIYDTAAGSFELGATCQVE